MYKVWIELALTKGQNVDSSNQLIGQSGYTKGKEMREVRWWKEGAKRMKQLWHTYN